MKSYPHNLRVILWITLCGARGTFEVVEYLLKVCFIVIELFETYFGMKKPRKHKVLGIFLAED